MNIGIIVESQSDDMLHNARATADTLTQHPAPKPPTKRPTPITTGPDPRLVLNK